MPSLPEKVISLLSKSPSPSPSPSPLTTDSTAQELGKQFAKGIFVRCCKMTFLCAPTPSPTQAHRRWRQPSRLIPCSSNNQTFTNLVTPSFNKEGLSGSTECDSGDEHCSTVPVCKASCCHKHPKIFQNLRTTGYRNEKYSSQKRKVQFTESDKSRELQVTESEKYMCNGDEQCDCSSLGGTDRHRVSRTGTQQRLYGNLCLSAGVICEEESVISAQFNHYQSLSQILTDIIMTGVSTV